MSQLLVQNLTIDTLGERNLVNSISFELSKGDRLGLLGESGSGKSLTALAITGLLPEDLKVGGSISYEGYELLGASETKLCEVRGAGIGIVFQDSLTSLDPLMKLGNQLARPLRKFQGLKGEQLEAEIIRALTEVKISNPERASRSYPHQVSGGERQRVAIALALACQPNILIADEITTSLDVIVQSEILTLLDSLIEERGMSLIFITHDVAVAAQITQEVLILRDGEILETGKIQEVLSSPKSSYAKELLESARSLDFLLGEFKEGELR